MKILLGLLAGLRAFLHASKLMPPVSLECAGPFMQWPDSLGVGAIEHLSALPSYIHKTDFQQHPQMFGNRRLRQIESGDDVVDGALLDYEERENVAPAGFCHGVEGVGSGGGARHGRIIFLYGNMSSVIFGPPDLRAGLKHGTYMRHNCARAGKIDGYVEPDFGI